MSPVDAQSIQQADCVVGHILECVRHTDSLGSSRRAEDRVEVGIPHLLDLGGQPYVTVVEPDHVQSLFGELPAELRVPQNHLPTEPHDQE